MSTPQAADEAAIREQAYYLWEKDGRPDGRDNEYWHRAMVAVGEKSQLDALTQPPPKVRKAAAATPPSKVKAESKTKAAPKLRAAASKAVPAKASKADPDKKPKKK